MLNPIALYTHHSFFSVRLPRCWIVFVSDFFAFFVDQKTPFLLVKSSTLW